MEKKWFEHKNVQYIIIYALKSDTPVIFREIFINANMQMAHAMLIDSDGYLDGGPGN